MIRLQVLSACLFGMLVAALFAPWPLRSQLFVERDGCHEGNAIVAPVTVTDTAGGMQIFARNKKRCGVTVANRGTVSMYCTFTTGPFGVAPTVAAGWLIKANEIHSWRHDAQEQMKCITDTATSTTAYVADSRIN